MKIPRLSSRVRSLVAKAETHGTTGVGALLLGALVASGAVDISNVDTVALSHYWDQLLNSITGIEQALSSIKFGNISLGAVVSFLLFRHRAPGPKSGE
jgi:hypothetical protein